MEDARVDRLGCLLRENGVVLAELVPPGNGSCTAKRASSRKIARSVRAVCGGSMERWNFETRFAGVKCARPSAVSADGATVAALATHMFEADEQATSSLGACLAAARSTSASEPEKPSARKVSSDGRSCGGSTACFRPRSARNFIFASPCNAASRGFEAALPCAIEATLPSERPA